MTRILCVIDNEIQEGSGLQSEHGLSFWIETPRGNVLFDTGQTSSVLSHNFKKLGLDVRNISALVLSHAHFDHSGGLSFILNTNKDLPIYAHLNLFEKRYYRMEGIIRSVGLSEDNIGLFDQANVKLSDQPVKVIPKLWTTGDIRIRREALGSSPFLYTINDEEWILDRYTDDMSLVLESQEGLILLCGCCHAGILNTMYHVQNTFKQAIIAVLGGIHLVYSTEQYINHVINILDREFKQTKFLLNHCTGKEALELIKNELGDRVINFPAGSVFSFND